MREIIFRGKVSTEKLDELGVEHDNGWIYGYCVDGFIVGDVVEATDEYIALEFWWPVKRETVGQYTGFKDKNGVEIYEGDILSWGPRDHAPNSDVFFDDGVFKISDPSSDTWELLIDVLNGAKVIGNTWDNPDLLKK